MIPTTIATIAATAMSPGTNPAPKVPTVTSVPIWYTFLLEIAGFIKLPISRNSAYVIIKGYCAESALCAR